MDLHSIQRYRFARTRDDLALAPGERFVAGGTWMFSEPQVDTTALVDLTTMGWPSWEENDSGLRIASTCTIAELTRARLRPDRPARILFAQCADALLASAKIWTVATVGGNICRSFAAGAMIHLAVALDGVAEIWTPDGGERRAVIAGLITGNGTNSLRPGEVLRAVHLPARALRARTAFRKIALAELGRSGAVVSGRVDEDGAATFAITAATLTPTVLGFATLPSADRLRFEIDSAAGYYTDPLGSADWRRAVTGVLAEQIRVEFGGPS